MNTNVPPLEVTVQRPSTACAGTSAGCLEDDPFTIPFRIRQEPNILKNPKHPKSVQVERYPRNW